MRAKLAQQREPRRWTQDLLSGYALLTALTVRHNKQKTISG